MKKLTYDMYAKYKEKYFIDIHDICHYRTNSFRNPYDLSHVKATYIKDYKNCSDFIKYIYYNMISPEMGTWAIKYNLFENFSKLSNIENIPVFVQDKFFFLAYVSPKYINKKYFDECPIHAKSHLVIPLKSFMELISLKFGIVLLKSPINKDKFIIGYYDDNGKFKVVKDENNECEIYVKSGDYFDYYDLMIKYFNYIKKQYP